ncbi:MAG: hypothetical protein HYX99_03875 [Chloroflexi bacterium]|nr:hypothetical protein [Chloroflexota bacterium]
MFVGLVLIIIGGAALAAKLGLIQGSIWGYVWPALLIVLGLSILVPRRRWRFFCGPWWGPWQDRPR